MEYWVLGACRKEKQKKAPGRVPLTYSSVGNLGAGLRGKELVHALHEP